MLSEDPNYRQKSDDGHYGNKEKTNFDRLFDKAAARYLQNPCRKTHEGSISSYNEYDSPVYQRGMFIDTRCNQAKIHSYKEMQKALRELKAIYPSDARISSAGQSQGYDGSENALDIWTLQIPAIGKPEQTAFLVSGHHPEFSGPESVYLVAERLLELYHAGNENVKKLRENL